VNDIVSKSDLFLAALGALLASYEEEELVSVPITKIRTLLDHYDLP